MKNQNYRGGIFDNLDMAFIACFILCTVAFVLLILWVQSVDYSHLEKVALESLPPRVVKLILPKKDEIKAEQKKPDSALKSKKKEEAEKQKQKDMNIAKRIEKARESVQQNITRTEERVTKANVLKILSGKGPGTQGRTIGKSLMDVGFDNFGDLDKKLAGIEGLTKIEAKKGDRNVEGGGKSKGDLTQTASISDLLQGFEDAKISSISKIGNLEFEEPEVIDNPSYTGTRNPQDVARAISERKRSITLLYEEMLRTDPDMQGKITVVLVIEGDGTVSSARILASETTLSNSRLHDSILRRVRKWTFPPSSGGAVEMKSPFIFKPA